MSAGKRLFSVVGAVQEVDVLKVTDVEVSSEFTSPFRECRCCTSRTVAVGRRG